MKTTQYYPVIQTSDVAGTSAFYRRHFGFEAAFESDWYVHLQSAANPVVNLAVLQAGHPTVPEQARASIAGLILNFEVADVDREFERLSAAGVSIAKPLIDEDFGQRHFICTEPNGVLIDVITPIAPSAEFAGQYRPQDLPTA
ncbi:MAG: VOC family protein [Burkholderiaceae bacterium]